MGSLLLALLAAGFDREVEPPLRQRRAACHGAAMQSGGVRLDSRDSARRVAANEDRAPPGAFRKVQKPALLRCLGIDHSRLTYPYQGRNFRWTDVAGRVVEDIIA